MPTYYDEIAKGYDELHREEQEEKLKLMTSSIQLDQDDYILDVGCGSGFAESFFKGKYVGVDPSRELLKKADGNVVQGVAEKLPFKDDVFDFILCVSSLHNFDNPRKGIEEMKRVGKERFVITVFRRGSDKGKVEALRELINDYLEVQMVVEQKNDYIYFCT